MTRPASSADRMAVRTVRFMRWLPNRSDETKLRSLAGRSRPRLADTFCVGCISKGAGPRTGERNERTAAEAGSAGVDRDRGWSLVHGARPGGERQAAQGALLGHAGVPVAGDAVEPERRRGPEDRQTEGEKRPRPY